MTRIFSFFARFFQRIAAEHHEDREQADNKDDDVSLVGVLEAQNGGVGAALDDEEDEEGQKQADRASIARI